MVRALSWSERDHMRGLSWKDDPRCPAFDELSIIEVRHWTFEGAEESGEIVVASSVAADIAAVFDVIARERFPIQSVSRIDFFDADDDRSMAANNCSAFCFREIAIGGGLSKHALGFAVDINPVQNPYVVGGRVLPDAAREFLDRDNLRPGMLVRPSPVISAFDAMGWEWGGDWTSKSDYHHFAKV